MPYLAELTFEADVGSGEAALRKLCNCMRWLHEDARVTARAGDGVTIITVSFPCPAWQGTAWNTAAEAFVEAVWELEGSAEGTGYGIRAA